MGEELEEPGAAGSRAAEDPDEPRLESVALAHSSSAIRGAARTKILKPSTQSRIVTTAGPMIPIGPPAASVIETGCAPDHRVARRLEERRERVDG